MGEFSFDHIRCETTPLTSSVVDSLSLTLCHVRIEVRRAVSSVGQSARFTSVRSMVRVHYRPFHFSICNSLVNNASKIKDFEEE